MAGSLIWTLNSITTLDLMKVMQGGTVRAELQTRPHHTIFGFQYGNDTLRANHMEDLASTMLGLGQVMFHQSYHKTVCTYGRGLREPFRQEALV